MIIRRISQGIKEQDWFVVMVEVMIVVVGIFIGLQVDDWNEARKDRLEERQYLERILADLDDSIVLQEIEVNLAQNRLNSVNFSWDVINQGNLPSEKKLEFELGLEYMGIVRSFRLKLETILEMQSSGKVELIQDIQVRAALSELQEFYKRQKETIALVMERFSPGFHIFDQNIRNIRNLETNEVSIHYEFEQLVENPPFLHAYSTSMNTMRIFNSFHGNILKETRKTRDMVYAELKELEETQ